MKTINVNPLVLALLQWSTEDYCDHQFVQGDLQIQRLFKGYNTPLARMHESAEFWEAFRTRWSEHDEEWLSDLMAGGQLGLWLEGNGPSVDDLYDSYRKYHLMDSFESLPVAVQRIVNEQLRLALISESNH